MKLKSLVTTLIIAFISIISHSEETQRLVILHTNDTHSQLDPDDKDRGGILRRKVLIDSIRNIEKNVLLIDAGDAVQGTLYFTLYGGEAERKLMDALGYDIIIAGNHEFDNGMESLARQYRESKSIRISTNYDLRNTELEGLFVPYAIKEYNGKRIGIIGINLNPEGMIDSKNCKGVKYLDALKAANSTAWHLKHNEHADAVIAVTHVGYDESTPLFPCDTDIARNSENIDIIIGGHTHTLINPESLDSPAHKIPNLNSDTVLIAQAEKAGRYLGEITIDLNTMKPESRLITVNRRLDDRIDANTAKLLEPYRHGVDSLMAVKIAHTKTALESDGSALLNLITDFVMQQGETLVQGNVDLAIMNKGGIRRSLPKGDITKGMIISMLPFENHITVIDIKGKDLLEAFDIMAKRGGDGVSKGVKVLYDGTIGKCTDTAINGKQVDPEKKYRVATIDYLANGGDYMKPLTKGSVIAKSDNILYEDLLNYLVSDKMKGKKLNPPTETRMTDIGNQ